MNNFNFIRKSLFRKKICAIENATAIKNSIKYAA